MQENNQNMPEDKQEELKEENMEKSDSSSKALVISLVVIIIIMLAGGGYLYYHLSSKITDLETDLDNKEQKVEKQVDDQKDEDKIEVKDEEVKEPEKDEEDEPKEETVETKEIKYYNADYGFGFTLPATWKGYRVKEEDTSWGDFKAKSLYFGFEEQESLFAVSIFTKEQWDKLQDSPDARQVSKLGENSKYVFSWSHSQYLENDEMEKRASEIQDIIKTFYTDAK